MTIPHDIRRQLVASGAFTGAEHELGDERELISEEILDSLGIYQMVAFLEEHFGIEVDDDELVYENFATIGDIARMVQTKLG